MLRFIITRRSFEGLKKIISQNEKEVREIIKRNNLKIYARENDDPKFYELMKSLGAKVEGYPDKFIVSDVNAIKKGKRDALIHEAAKKADLSTLKNLVKKGADVNLKNGNGSTALHIVAKQGNADFVKFYHKNDKEKIASLPSKQDYIDVVSFLIEKGADVTVKDRNNYEPLYYAAKRSRTEIVEILLK